MSAADTSDARNEVSVAPRLRVLTDRLAGAEYRLPACASITVGHSLENDVVLRGRETAGLSLELHQGTDTTMLRVLTGAATVLGRHVTAGEEVLLPPYLPVRFGEFAFAIGGEDDGRWAEARWLARVDDHPRSAEQAMPRAALTQRAATRLDPMRAWIVRYLPARAMIAGCALSLVAIGSLPVVGQFFSVDLRDPVLVGNRLRAAGFSMLSIKPDPASGNLMIAGTVRDDAAADRLNALVAQDFPDATVSVTTTSAMAQEASDILRTNHVDAQARVVRNGVLEIESEYLPVDRQVELTALLKSDIPALRHVAYRMTSARGPDDLRYFFNSPKYGAASFVDGHPGYIATADGSRWFSGATLPTGHRIVSIGSGRILLERAGQVEALVM